MEVETLTFALTEVKKPDANGIVALVQYSKFSRLMRYMHVYNIL